MAMRIDKSQSRTPATAPETENRQRVESSQHGFSVDLSKESDQQVRQHLEELLGKI